MPSRRLLRRNRAGSRRLLSRLRPYRLLLSVRYRIAAPKKLASRVVVFAERCLVCEGPQLQEGTSNIFDGLAHRQGPSKHRRCQDRRAGLHLWQPERAGCRPIALAGAQGVNAASQYRQQADRDRAGAMRMSDDQAKQQSDADAELEREIRKDRKFTLTEAIGRMAGPGAMKGESPIARMQQAEVEIETWLRRHLMDADEGLQAVLLCGVKRSDLLLDNFDQPLAVLASYCQRVLGSDYLLKELPVRARPTSNGDAYSASDPTSRRRELRLTRTIPTRSSRSAALCPASSSSWPRVRDRANTSVPLCKLPTRERAWIRALEIN